MGIFRKAVDAAKTEWAGRHERRKQREENRSARIAAEIKRNKRKAKLYKSRAEVNKARAKARSYGEKPVKMIRGVDVAGRNTFTVPVKKKESKKYDRYFDEGTTIFGTKEYWDR